jgi:hypothetical protein
MVTVQEARAVRNRVAHDNARRMRALTARIAVTVTLLPVLLVAAVSPAAAQGVAEQRFTSGLAGPVGIVAVILGAGGLLVGLLRRRRTGPARAAVRAGIDPSRPTANETTVRIDTAA